MYKNRYSKNRFYSKRLVLEISTFVEITSKLNSNIIKPT